MYKLLLVSIRASSAAPKIIPRLLSGRKCGGVVESCLLCWFRIVRNFGQALSRILAFAVVWVAASCSDSVRPLSCILARPAQCEFAPQHQKSRAMPVCGSGSVAGFVKMRSLGSVRPCADSVRPPSCILCTFMNALLVSHRASSAVWVATSCGN